MSPERARHGVSALIGAWLLAACAATDPAPIGTDQQTIIGGTPTAEHEAVVALVDADGAALCTGTLIAPELVLTAAHCVLHEGRTRLPHAVFVGEDTQAPGRRVRVQAALVHPGYDEFLHTDDVALLRLLEPLSIAPIAPGSAAAVAGGGSVRLVGFGASEDAPPGRKYVRDEALQDADAAFVHATGTCFGDSGGPVLAADETGGWQVVAVVSLGRFDCSSTRAVRLDGLLGWIADGSLALAPPACQSGDGQCGARCALGDSDCACVADGRCTRCATDDPDCSPACAADGVCALACLAPDPDCGRVDAGGACGADRECASGACVGGECRRACRLDGPVADCPSFLECLPLGASASTGYCSKSIARTEGCSCLPGQSHGSAAALITLLLLCLCALVRPQKPQVHQGGIR